MTVLHLLCGFVGSSWQAKRRQQEMVKLVNQGRGVMLRAASIPVSHWPWVKLSGLNAPRTDC